MAKWSKCTKFDFRWAPPQTLLGELTALPQTSQMYLRGLLLREGRGIRRKGKGKEEGKGRTRAREGEMK